MFKKISKKIRIATLLIVALLGLAAMFVQPKVSAAVTFGGPFDCDANATIRCGAPNTNTIINNYNSDYSVRDIYNYFGITTDEIHALGTTAVAGSVTKSGDVYVGNHLVATGAITAGRQFIPGSTQVKYGATTFYKRAPSVSFENNSLTAYVVMQNGHFMYAILSACANSVVAHPVTPPAAQLACKQLLLTPGAIESNGDQKYSFTAGASVTNGSIASYVFNLGNGNTQTVATTATSATSDTVTYAPGTYHVSVTVNGVAGDIFTTAPTPVTCTGSFTVQPNGSLTCTMLGLNNISTNATTGDVTYTLTAQATPSANATIEKYIFSFGDSAGTTQTVTTNAHSATSEQFIYKAGTTYKPIFVTVYGKGANGNTVTSGGVGTNCATNLTVPPQTCATGSTASSCTPTCTAPNGQTFPAGSSACTTTVVTTSTPPSSLPSTGAGSVAGIFTGISVLGGLGYRRFLTRRLVREI